MVPWICPRCLTSNGPAAMTCQNANCAAGASVGFIGTGTVGTTRCGICGSEMPCGKTHAICSGSFPGEQGSFSVSTFGAGGGMFILDARSRDARYCDL